MDGQGLALDNIFVKRLRSNVKHEDVYRKGYANIGGLMAGLAQIFCILQRGAAALVPRISDADLRLFPLEGKALQRHGESTTGPRRPAAVVKRTQLKLAENCLDRCATSLCTEQYPQERRCFGTISPGWGGGIRIVLVASGVFGVDVRSVFV